VKLVVLPEDQLEGGCVYPWKGYKSGRRRLVFVTELNEMLEAFFFPLSLTSNLCPVTIKHLKL
jgi:hypothetical protein